MYGETQCAAKGIMNLTFLVQLQLWSPPTAAADGKDSSSLNSSFEIIPPALLFVRFEIDPSLSHPYAYTLIFQII
jgi:hypothetical protein